MVDDAWSSGIYEAFDGSVPESAKVLIVDDDTVGGRTVAEAVEALGHRVELVHGWADAVRAFGPDVDLVLMDAVLPTVDGFKLTKMMRQRAKAYTPIVFLTGLGDDRARELGIQCGADDFLVKPVDFVELRVRMQAMLRIRRLTQALERHRARLSELAHVDELTGVPNRRSLDQRLVSEVSRAARHRHSLSVLMIDLDRFKAVNDTYGHATGDRLLVFMGRLLRESLRGHDMPFRYGGEEFVVLAPDTTGPDAIHLAERLRTRFAAESGAESEAGPQTLSVGIGWVRDGAGASVTALLREADEALYAAKAGGRDRIVVAAPLGGAVGAETTA